MPRTRGVAGWWRNHPDPASRRHGSPARRIGGNASLSCRLAPQGIVVSTEDTTRWCGVARSSNAPGAFFLTLRVDLELLGDEGVPGERLTCMDEVQVATLDRSLCLELPGTAPYVDHDRG